MPRILALVVTYNRKDLLQQCLAAIAAQTRPCDDIIVVDNGSSDSTAGMLTECWAHQVQTHVLSPNIGSAGGFSAGFRIAYAQGADFIWAMDDDVIPDPDALEKLLHAEQVLEAKGIARAFLCSTPRTPAGDITNTPGIDTRRNPIHYRVWPALLEHKMVPVTRSTFVSFLLPRSTVAEYGLPLAPMFIWGEDSEYTTRITRNYPGFIVGDSKVLHVRSVSGVLSIVSETHPVRLRYHRYHVRNHLYIARKYSGTRSFVGKLLSKLRLVARLVLTGNWRKAQLVGQGMLDSLSFEPQIEPGEASTESLGVTVTRPGPPRDAPLPQGRESAAVARAAA
ncbi:MAG: glycosyltransferase family 2 protein [Panacagrimonas sp.]